MINGIGLYILKLNLNRNSNKMVYIQVWLMNQGVLIEYRLELDVASQLNDQCPLKQKMSQVQDEQGRWESSNENHIRWMKKQWETHSYKKRSAGCIHHNIGDGYERFLEKPTKRWRNRKSMQAQETVKIFKQCIEGVKKLHNTCKKRPMLHQRKCNPFWWKIKWFPSRV